MNYLRITAFGLMLLPAVAGAAVQLDVEADITLIKHGVIGAKMMTYDMSYAVLIRCTDKIQLVKKTDLWIAKENLKWQTLVQVDNKTQHVHEGTIEAGTMLGTSYDYPNGKDNPPVKKVHPTLITKLHPVVSWNPPGPGTYEVRCVANYQATIPDATMANNTSIGVVTVVPKPPPPPPPPKVGLGGPAIGKGQVVPGVMEAVAKPHLAVISANAEIQKGCELPEPALIAVVTVKNSGGPLAAGKGTISLKELGGANLGSAGIPLPAFTAGQTHKISLPATTRQPYSSLPGRHKIQVILSPGMEKGPASFIKPIQPFDLSATFPPGHCASRVRTLVPGERTAPVQRQAPR